MGHFYFNKMDKMELIKEWEDKQEIFVYSVEELAYELKIHITTYYGNLLRNNICRNNAAKIIKMGVENFLDELYTRLDKNG